MLTPSNDDFPYHSHDRWYALHVRSNQEQQVARSLQSKGIETFLPTYRDRRQWSDRIKTLRVPLFPGYVFLRITFTDKLRVLTIPGVIQLVGNGTENTAISDDQIDAIRLILQSGVGCSPADMVPGDVVYVEQGPLRGLKGVVVTTGSSHRIVISITLLRRAVAAEIDPAWVRLVDRATLAGR